MERRQTPCSLERENRLERVENADALGVAFIRRIREIYIEISRLSTRDRFADTDENFVDAGASTRVKSSRPLRERREEISNISAVLPEYFPRFVPLDAASTFPTIRATRRQTDGVIFKGMKDG